MQYPCLEFWTGRLHKAFSDRVLRCTRNKGGSLEMFGNVSIFTTINRYSLPLCKKSPTQAPTAMKSSVSAGLSRQCRNNLPRLFFDKISIFQDCFLTKFQSFKIVLVPKRSFNQIKDVENSFLAIDGVEFGRGNKIPLWLFGFLY